jgi:hypothetical protein
MKNVIIILGLVACGGTGGNGDDAPSNVDPKLIAGGGVSDGPLGDTLHVHVVEADSATPIAGATVTVGDQTAQTDAAGLATFAVAGDPVTVSATMAMRAATTWVGVDGANVTIPLERTRRTIPMARVTGDITNWFNLPNPPLGKYTLGLVMYSFLDDPSAPENSIAQATNGGTPANICLNTGLQNNCMFQLNTRIGKQVLSAVIVEGDPRGTNNDTSDDTYTLIGYAVSDPMTLADGEMKTNVKLAQLTTPTMNLAVTFPAAPAGMSHVIAIPELALGDAGRLVFPLPPLTPAAATAKVPTPGGAIAGTYELVALATPSATATTPFSTAFVHDVSGSATVPSFLPAPAVATGGAIAFSGDANFKTAQLKRNGDTLWNLAVLDGTTSVTLPTLTPDPLGAGAAELSINNADAAGFDAKKFDIAATRKALVRAAGAKNMFTR